MATEWDRALVTQRGVGGEGKTGVGRLPSSTDHVAWVRGGPPAVLRRHSGKKGNMRWWRSTEGPRRDGAMLSPVILGDYTMEKRERGREERKFDRRAYLG